MLEGLRGYAGVALVCSVSEISRVLDWALSCERGLEGSTALEKKLMDKEASSGF